MSYKQTYAGVDREVVLIIYMVNNIRILFFTRG